MSEQEWRDLLESLVELQDAVAEAEEESSCTREYVRREHFPFLDTRFRLYDEYLATGRPQQFMQFVRLLPNEFEDLYEIIGGRLQHPSTHAGPINGRQRLMIYLRFVAFGGTFVSFALAADCGRETVSAIVAEVTDVIIDELHEIAFPPPLTRERLQAIANATHDRYDYPRARRIMESTFGILARRFQILMQPMQVNPARAARIVKAFLILHNLLPRRQDAHGGQQGSSEEALHSVERTIAETGASAAKENEERERITLYSL
ncbi:unnamed protein product [Cylicocyclus nassatus]|uniref:DDE Tnp4 domain-containing protein n=1 Tax=Cylicocyclus nassatus TaxID=53992 RepID=A0AA36GYY9_CYLNA|nr:unnamed protein product [Cylicocyclus nassatus]